MPVTARLAPHEQGPKRLFEAVDAYIDGKRLHCSPRTIEFEEERLISLKRYFGDVPLTAITAKAIAEFQRARHENGIANRTINMDVGVLSRVLKSCGRWRALGGPRAEPARASASGRPSPDARGTEAPLRQLPPSNPEWEHVYCAAVVAANTSMRPVEVKHLRRCDVDLVKKLALRPTQQERDEPPRHSAQRVGRRRQSHGCSSARTCSATPSRSTFSGLPASGGATTPTEPMLKWDTAWRALRDAAGLPRFRFHDLRHTVITELAELGRGGPRAGVDQRPPVAADAGALLAHPYRREAAGP